MDLGGYICASMREGRGAHSGSGRLPNDSVAQLVEQYTFNVWVLGSNPSGITGFWRFGMKDVELIGVGLGLVGCIFLVKFDSYSF